MLDGPRLLLVCVASSPLVPSLQLTHRADPSQLSVTVLD